MTSAGRTGWLDALRASAGERFAALGYPSTRVEAWKYTSLRPVLKHDFALAPASQGAVALPAPLADTAGRLVVVDGHVRADLSTLDALPAGLTVRSLAAAIAADDDGLASHLARGATRLADAPFAARNAERFVDGAFVHLARGAAVLAPLEILHVARAAAGATVRHPRVLLVTEATSEVTVVERFVSAGDAAGATLTNAVTQIVAGPSSVVRHVKDLREAEGAFHVGLLLAEVGRDATVETHAVSLGAALGRSEIRALLDEPGASCRLNGLYLPHGEQVHDNYTEIEHLAPHTTSHQLYKGVVDDSGTGTFQGRVLIHEGARGSESHQLTNNLLLGDRATVNAKPQLEIDNDDVKATHGSTVGQLDPKALFYLLSRGIEPRQARLILLAAFAREVLSALPVPALRADLDAALEQRLAAVAAHQTGAA